MCVEEIGCASESILSSGCEPRSLSKIVDKDILSLLVQYVTLVIFKISPEHTRCLITSLND